MRWIPFLSLFLFACAAPAEPVQPTPDVQATVEAQVQKMLATAVPTATPRVVRVPFPTFTPTPRPTATPTSAPTPSLPPARTLAIQDMRDASDDEKFWLDREPVLLVGCLAIDDPLDAGGEYWFTFSSDGRFDSSRFMANVTGFAGWPRRGGCYEMVVRYEGSDELCYYTDRFGFYPNLTGCVSWWQHTPGFYLVSGDGAAHITKSEWRQKYLDR